MNSVDLVRAVSIVGLVLSVAAALFCAVLSGLHATRTNPGDALRLAGRLPTDTPRRARLRSALVVSQIALSFVLLAGVGLLVNSLWRLKHVDLGFEPEGVVTMGLHSTPAEAIDFYRDVVQGVRNLSDVESASVVSSLPLEGVDLMTGFEIQGRPRRPDQPRPEAVVKVVGPAYFETMKVSLVEGRYLDTGDTADSEPVVVINQAVARGHWPGESAVGRQIQRGGPQRPWSRVAGVVRDVKVSGPAGATPMEFYVPHAQFLLLPNSRLALPNMVLVVRSASGLSQVVPRLRSVVRAVNPDTLVTNVAPMRDTLAQVMAPRELNTLVLGVFASLALSLTLVGVYGLISFAVGLRQQEIGIRMALGARRGQLVGSLLGGAGRIVALGVGLGLLGAGIAGRSMQALLFQVKSTDPLTFVTVVLMLAGASLAAAYMPVRRAVGGDPSAALRTD